jgi:hypothetical protein
MLIDLKTIDKVYINLDRDAERRSLFEAQLASLDYSNIERFSACVLPKQGDFNHGCSQSHLTVMQANRNRVPFFLLEDDARATRWYDEYVSDGKIEVPDDADVVYIGFSAAGSWKELGVDFYCEPHDDKWVRLKHCLGTHSIIFLNSSIDVFISNARYSIKRKIPLDVSYAKTAIPNVKVYAPRKSLFYQWDKCWISTNVTIDTDHQEWISYKENGNVNFRRKYSNA